MAAVELDRHTASVVAWARRTRYRGGDVRIDHSLRRAGLTIEDVAQLRVQDPVPPVVVAGVAIAWDREPPAVRTTSGRWREVAAVLKRNPGRWACLGVQSSGSIKALRKLGCQAAGRKAKGEESRVELYARWPAP